MDSIIIEIKDTMETTCLHELYLEFKGKSINYAKQPKANGEVCLYFGMICGMSKSESISFMEYILDDWNAYAFDIINGKYKYINFTEMVYNAWVEHKIK